MPSTLVSAEELAAHLSDPSWAVVDCRHVLADHSAGRKQYGSGHIPGAFFADVENDLAGERTGRNGRHPLPDWETFGGYLRAIGVNDDTQIVAYDAGGDMFAARLWYLLRLAGHDRSAVLDGGIAAWTAAGHALETQDPQKRGDGTIGVRVRTELAVEADAVLRSLQTNEFTLLDARGADRFAGQNETIDPVAGHIPGAINRPFRSNFDETGHFKTPSRLREEFAALPIPAGQIVHQCGSGVSAAVNMLAMAVAGLPLRPLYPGSWSEWIADGTRPMVTF
ncbi:MAG: sulfurtransferase [Candidatus Baltobacteraceae bacterium]